MVGTDGFTWARAAAVPAASLADVRSGVESVLLFSVSFLRVSLHISFSASSDHCWEQYFLFTFPSGLFINV